MLILAAGGVVVVATGIIIAVVVGGDDSSTKTDKSSTAAGSTAKAGAPSSSPAGKLDEDRKHLLDDVDIVGTFDVHAEGEGAPPDGTLTLKKTGGEAFRGELVAGATTYYVAAHRTGDLLAMAWSEQKRYLGAASMEFFCDMSLEARFGDVEGGRGKAMITGGNSAFTGTWTVERGTIPGAGDSWSGRVDGKPFGASATVVRFGVKSADNGTDHYLLIRRGDVLGGGYRYDKKPFFAAHVRIASGGAALDGHWLASTETIPTPKALTLKKQGATPIATPPALKLAGTNKTAAGIACLDVPAEGHTLFPKKKPGGGGGGQSGDTCSSPYTKCPNSGCVNLESDPQNCGACGRSCSVRLSLCKNGSCDCFEVEKDNNGGVCP